MTEFDIKQFSADHVARYEASGGTDGRMLNGYPTVVVTTRGAKSGAVRKFPVMRVSDGTRYALVASLGGAPANPVWYHNVRAHPEVTLRDGTEVGRYTAREVHGAERAQWWARAVEAFPAYAGYQERTERVIPVFVLDPAPDPDPGTGTGTGTGATGPA
ncbi:nitroreductase family deazaflavin-dependent oxidoreductase [Streptomyces sp. XM4011]|uniref:nitroreductase family deazaflavin-dependent oxidoreductase n=1 Tax=Streptomyces sp. XM4011 TaxID=2929780 RepID=UPI001FF98A1D|nr:nitroreductase family deazaflavin-dependent oxidoreductase [Streptomyces sp. XM4011]MCK1814664.1 nitroreductase family deazaflavin-dependent oxidoreductase [Streptomyces sp. XM4011]